MPYFTPIEIEVLVFHNFMIEEHTRIGTPSVSKAIDRLVSLELLEPNTKNTTERGRMLVEMLCDTPLPVKKWADPRED